MRSLRLCTQHGFFTIVQKKPGEFHIRGRLPRRTGDRRWKDAHSGSARLTGPALGGVEVIVEGSLCQQRGVAIGDSLRAPAGIDSPAIANDEDNRFLGHIGCL